MRQYGRDDVQFETWYSDWMKRLALQHSLTELESMLGMKSSEATHAARAHLRAVDRTASMRGNSSARASTRNVVAAAGDTVLAIKGAMEIHELFPEQAKQQGE